MPGDWIDNIEMLSGKYKLYVPDLPGFGESQLLDQEHSIPVFTQFVEDFTETLMLKNFFLMGHSIGGGVALNYALKFPAKVKKLVLVSSLCLGREIAFWVRLMSIQAQVLGSAILAILKSTKWVIDTLTLPVKFIMPFSRANVNLGTNIATLKEQTLVLFDRLDALKTPTLVVWGARDNIVPVKQAFTAVQEIPDCRLKVFENSGHSVHKDEIKEFSILLSGFLG